MTLAVTLYSRPNATPKCQGCEATKRRLTAKGIPFTEVDVDDDPLTQEALAYCGFTSVPVVFAATRFGELPPWAGYRPDRIDALVPHVVADAMGAGKLTLLPNVGQMTNGGAA